MIGLLILRKPLLSLLSLIKSLRFKEVELGFDRSVAKLEAKAAEVLPPAKEGEPRVAFHERELELAEESPRTAVIEAWLRVAAASAAALKRATPGVREGKLFQPSYIEAKLREAHLLNDPQLRLFRDLRYARNAAVHSSDLSLDQSSALSYVATANRLIALLEAIPNAPVMPAPAAP